MTSKDILPPTPEILQAIGDMLNWQMEECVRNGANSVSTPDELVLVAGWLCGIDDAGANSTPQEEEDLVYRLRKRAEIRRQIPDRKSVQEGKPDRIADLLEESATEIERLREIEWMYNDLNE